METLSATIFVKKIPILSPLLNIIHTGMDKDQQQSKVIKNADEVVSSIVNIFLGNYALVIKVLLMVWMKNAFCVKSIILLLKVKELN